MKNATRFLFIVVVAILTISCSSQSGPVRGVDELLQDMGLQRGASVTRIRSYLINSWRRVDDSNLIIRSGVDNQFLVTLLVPCLGLDSALFIGYTTTAGSLDRFDSILVEGPGRRNEVCRIDEIVELIPVTSN